MEKKILHRLRRIEGQVRRLETMIETDGVCSDIIPQLLAVRGAFNSAVREYLKHSLDSCLGKADQGEMRQVIKMLLKHG